MAAHSGSDAAHYSLWSCDADQSKEQEKCVI